MKGPLQKELESGFERLSPLGDDPMGGLEKFTIRPVGNPTLINGHVNGELARSLFLGMHKKISQRTRTLGKNRTIYSKIIYEPKMAIKINALGSVEMEVVNAQRLENVERVSEILVDELFLSFGQNVSEILEVFDLFWARVAQQEYVAPELMSTLLICVEEKKHSRNASVIENKPYPAPELNFEISRADVDGEYNGDGNISIRVVSIREMLRNYFEKYPHRYHEAIEKVVGFGDFSTENLEQIVEEQISRVGAWEFAVRIWMQVRDWEKEVAKKHGIIEPLDDKEQWILCPRWEGKGAKYDIEGLAKIIEKHYKKTK